MSMKIVNINCRINCQYIYGNNRCKNNKVENMFCIEHNHVVCKFKKPWLRLAPPPAPTPKHNINVGLELKCNVCGCLLNTLGALLFSPPKGNIVKKYHICHTCFEQFLLKLKVNE